MRWSVLIARRHDMTFTNAMPLVDWSTALLRREHQRDVPKDLTGSQLLNRDPARRLGVNGAQEIKDHPFFAKHIDWKRLLAKKIQPPFKPAVVSGPLFRRGRGSEVYHDFILGIRY
jgi:hypothetical protein